MKKDMIFFSTDGVGLTSTSANHIANLAKEMVRGLETSLSGLRLFSTSVALIGSDSDKVLTVGASADDLSSVIKKLRTIAKANSLIAWLREAIKARERLLKEAEEYSLTQFCKDYGIEMPQPPLFVKPSPRTTIMPRSLWPNETGIMNLKLLPPLSARPFIPVAVLHRPVRLLPTTSSLLTK